MESKGWTPARSRELLGQLSDACMPVGDGIRLGLEEGATAVADCAISRPQRVFREDHKEGEEIRERGTETV